MASPFKQTSQLLNLGAVVTESGANTFTQEEQALPLSSLDREIFVVTDIQIEAGLPDVRAAFSTQVLAMVTKSSQDAMLNINNPTVVGLAALNMTSPSGGSEVSGPHSRKFPVIASTGTKQDYLCIIATPNFFLSCQGGNNTVAKSSQVRITGYRAKATADTYAALVTEELNQ